MQLKKDFLSIRDTDYVAYPLVLKKNHTVVGA